MPISDEPYRDPEEDDPRRRYKTPKALARLRRKFTLDMQLEAFREVFGRDPKGDDDLEEFVEEYLRELYNSGIDEP
jgi:3-methyladenine DNA glycosylase/8-oxoguanine DNA glycosylase